MPTARQRWCSLAALALMLLSSAAFALGLGEIRVKSQPGQPLLAEIPIISNEPGELEQLRAQLASPVTFERVGLPRPQGLVSDLDFTVALDDSGRPVIRVTSQTPVDVPVVNFLIEVDWGQGRLVREYAAVMDAPGAVASAAQPYIDAPQAAPSDNIVRPAEPVAEDLTAAEPTPAPAPTAVPSAASAPTTVPAVAPLAAAEAFALGFGDTLSVRRGQTLSQIASQIGGSGHSLDQTMIALLRANPEAFIQGNINRLKQGAVLRIPQAADMAQLDRTEAAALVRSQMDQWRQARRPIPQPAALAAPVATTADPAATTASGEARLEIAPPAASAANRAGTQSGTDAGGEGDMLANPQLQQTQEDLAARESEIQELRAQVAELEKLKQQQQQLIAMKDSDLAAAQQRAAQANGSAGTPVWAWAGWGLLLLGALAWAMSSRRKRQLATATVSRSPGFDSAALAAAMPAAPTIKTAEEEPVSMPESVPAPARPTWHSGDEAASVAPLNPAPAGRERLELAIAYLDLGDTVTARDLLNEVASGSDSAARQEALQLLRDID